MFESKHLPGLLSLFKARYPNALFFAQKKTPSLTGASINNIN